LFKEHLFVQAIFLNSGSQDMVNIPPFSKQDAYYYQFMQGLFDLSTSNDPDSVRTRFSAPTFASPVVEMQGKIQIRSELMSVSQLSKTNLYIHIV
jgi:hypothetical protein